MTRRLIEGLVAAVVAVLGVGVAAAGAPAATILPERPPAPNADGRAYELVTPPDKNNRRTDRPNANASANVGLASADGGGLLFSLSFGILDPDAGTAFPYQTDDVLIRRDSASGWSGEATVNIPSVEPAAGPADNHKAVSADLETSVWFHAVSLFPATRSRFSTRVFDNPGGERGSGWYDWFAQRPAFAPLFQNNEIDSALVDDGGARILRWGDYRGLLENPGTPAQEDPSSGQVAGRAVYLQEPAGSGSADLVNECSGTVLGGDATEVPARVGAGAATDVIDAQACEQGTTTSPRGAGIGAAVPSNVQSTALTTLSADGKRVFFQSPDGAATACTADTGTATNCPPALFVRQYGPGGPVVRWISRSRVTGAQQIGLYGAGARFEGASSDGRIVYFRTNSPLLDSDPNAGSSIETGVAQDDSWDLYRYELPASLAADPDSGQLSRVTGGPSGTADPNTNGPVGAAARYVSDDGSRAFFVTRGPVPGADATPPAGGATTAGGSPTDATARNLYLYENSGGVERWKFIARIPFAAAGNAIDACASTNVQPSSPLTSTTNGDRIGVTVREPDVNCVRGTPTGGAIAFETTGQLTADDTDAAGDIYVYDVAADELTRVTAPPPGSTPYGCDHDLNSVAVTQSCNGDLGFRASTLSVAGKERFGLGAFRHYNMAEDAEGRPTLYFASRLELVAGDVNGDRYDVYQWRPDQPLALISPGDTDDDSYYSGNSADGTDVFFATSKRIDPREIEDADFDVYDARVGDGFPFVTQASCDVLGGSCAGPPAPSPPVPDDPGSLGFEGPERLGPPAPRLRVAGLGAAQRRALVRRGRAKLRIVTPGAGRLTVRSRHLRPVALRVGGATTKVVTLRLDRGARRALRRRGRLKVAVVVRIGAERRTLTLSLRRPR